MGNGAQQSVLSRSCNEIPLVFGYAGDILDMQNYTEIPLAELSLYALPTRDALQAICESAAFRTSPKSCEFLRHIVNRSLSGDTDELKERLIGMSLLGREATYDTGSDAGVRVRANDVRKRLAAYNVATAGLSSFTFDLPSGSYVPRFLTRASLSFKVKEGSVDSRRAKLKRRLLFSNWRFRP